MNYSQRVVAVGLTCALSGVLALVGMVNVLHAEAETWTGQLPLQRRLVADSLSPADAARDPDCVRGDMKVLKAGIQYPLETKNVTSDCIRYTEAGSYGDSGGLTYVQLGYGSGSTTDASYGIHELAGNRLIRKFLYGSQMGIRVYEKPGLAAKYSQYGSQAHVVFSQVAPGDWTLNIPDTTSPLSVGFHKVSSDGKWLVVEASGAFWRINLDTKERVPFSSRVFPYGVGLDPHYYAAISDDGQTIAIAGGTSATQEMYIYDLSGCDASKVVNKVATGCKQRTMTKDMVAGDTTARVANLYFNPSADTLFYSAYEGKVWRRYSVSPAGTAEHLIEYLALGDSYSSGEGDGEGGTYYMKGTDGDGEVPKIPGTALFTYPYYLEKCHLSTRSYPYLLAGAAGLTSAQFHSVACSGAVENDVLNTKSDGIVKRERFNGHFRQLEFIEANDIVKQIKNDALSKFTPGRAAQIEFVAKYKPRVVTIGIGGNDMGFGNILSSCIITKGSSCDYATINKEQTARDIETNVYEKLRKIYRDLKAASPTTQFYAVGYPMQFTESETCDVNAQLDTVEREYAIHVVEYLNDIVRTAAANEGVTYLDIEDSLKGGNLCSGAEYPNVNGLTNGNDRYIFIGSESYHPNEKGHALIAASIKGQLGGKTIATAQPCGVGSVNCAQSVAMPNRPVYFGYVPDPAVIATFEGDFILQGGKSTVINLDGDRRMTIDAYVPDAKLDGLVGSEVRSTPIALESLRVDASRHIIGTLTIPANIPLGYHTIHLKVPLSTGEKVDLYQWIFVQASADDVDGDGIKNTVDPCPFVDPIGRDRDQDGRDDACDGYIGPAPIVVVPDPEPASDPEETPGQENNPQSGAGTNQPSVSSSTTTVQATQPAVLASHIVAAVLAPVVTSSTTIARIEPPEILRPATSESSEAGISSEQDAAITSSQSATATDVATSTDISQTKPAKGSDNQYVVIGVAAAVIFCAAIYLAVHWRRKKNSVS